MSPGPLRSSVFGLAGLGSTQGYPTALAPLTSLRHPTVLFSLDGVRGSNSRTGHGASGAPPVLIHFVH